MDALEQFPPNKRGTFAPGLPHTGWQLLEHSRIAQWDILEFSHNSKHVSPGFPEGCARRWCSRITIRITWASLSICAERSAPGRTTKKSFTRECLALGYAWFGGNCQKSGRAHDLH